MCIVKQACKAGHMVIHSVCLLWSITFCPHVLTPLLLFVMELSTGDRVFYTRSTGLRVPAKLVGLLHDGHVELEYDRVVGKPSIIDVPWTPSPLVSPVSSLHHHLHQFPQLTSLRKFLWTSLLMEDPFVVAPQHDSHHIPQPEA